MLTAVTTATIKSKVFQLSRKKIRGPYAIILMAASAMKIAVNT
jgi:hypothetical protein